MVSEAQQRFSEALNALAVEQRLSFHIPEGYVYLRCIRSYLDRVPLDGRDFCVEFDWRSLRGGDRYYDVDATATGVHAQAELGGPLALIGAGANPMRRER